MLKSITRVGLLLVKAAVMGGVMPPVIVVIITAELTIRIQVSNLLLGLCRINCNGIKLLQGMAVNRVSYVKKLDVDYIQLKKGYVRFPIFMCIRDKKVRRNKHFGTLNTTSALCFPLVGSDAAATGVAVTVASIASVNPTSQAVWS